jgi:hypothetical protein
MGTKKMLRMTWKRVKKTWEVMKIWRISTAMNHLMSFRQLIKNRK